MREMSDEIHALLATDGDAIPPPLRAQAIRELQFEIASLRRELSVTGYVVRTDALRRERDQARAEVEEFKRIRDLLVRALVRATGASEGAVRDAPLTVAMAHVAEVARLRGDAERWRAVADIPDDCEHGTGAWGMSGGELAFGGDDVLRAHLDRLRAAMLEDKFAGDCTTCGGPVNHRPGKPGEFDHRCPGPRVSEDK